MRKITFFILAIFVTGITGAVAHDRADIAAAQFRTTAEPTKTYDDGKKFNEGTTIFEKTKGLKYSEAIPLFISAGKTWEECLNIKGYNHVEVRQNIAIAYMNAGIGYRVSGQYNEAISILNKSIAYNSENADIYKQLGSTYEELNQFDRAIDAYKHTIRINPNNLVSYVDIGNIYYNNKTRNEENKNIALYFYEKALAVTSSADENIRDRLALKVAESYAEKLKEQGYSSSRANPEAIKIPARPAATATAR